MIIDLAGILDGTGPARLLDMVEGRSKQVSSVGSGWANEVASGMALLHTVA